MKKITFVFFLCFLAALLILFAFRKKIIESQRISVQPKVVIPVNPDKKNEGSNTKDVNMPDIHFSSFIPLFSTEILIESKTADINADTYEDQVLLVRRTGVHGLILVIALYNPATGSYTRSYELQTEIMQIKSFSFFILDITGSHVNSLVFSGINDNGETIFKAFLPGGTKNSFSLTVIADFVSDGIIFIQEIQRSDAYYSSNAQGESFPVWVYSTDSGLGANTLDQIQMLYKWNQTLHSYVKTSETKITGQRMEANELAKILDGEADTFERFLTGLWYKPQATPSEIRYLFFNPETQEIIFLVHDSQEVYLWTNSVLRRNGMYITTKNIEIASLIRRIDIALIASDEIKLKVNDDVAMIINEDNMWDGTYKKMSGKTPVYSEKKPEVTIAMFISFLEAVGGNWKLNETASFSVKNNRYTIVTPETQDSGYFSFNYINGKAILQFRSQSQVKILNGYYQIYINEETLPDKLRRETVTLVPSSVTATGVYADGKQPMILERIQGAGSARNTAILGIK